MRSFYQNVDCGTCGATILTDTRGPLTRDPHQHEEDCPEADPFTEDED